MKDALSASDASALAATAADWLVESGLGGSDVPELVAGLCRHLNAGGFAIDRSGCAILTLHPQNVSQEVTWRSDDDSATTTYYTPKLMQDPDNRGGPYSQLALSRVSYKRFFLDRTRAAEDMPLLARLRTEGYTEYFGFFHATGGAAAITPFARQVGLAPCVVGSFATRRPGGFGEAEVACLKPVSKTLALAAKARTNFETGARLLDIYVGRSCGSQVLDGRITRGDSDRISCGIWFCDLRQSSRLVTELPPDDYIALLNRYFDVTVGAVMAAGGEVLKFMGDAVMGIFPSDRPGERHRYAGTRAQRLDENSAGHPHPGCARPAPGGRHCSSRGRSDVRQVRHRRAAGLHRHRPRRQRSRAAAGTDQAAWPSCAGFGVVCQADSRSLRVRWSASGRGVR